VRRALARTGKTNQGLSILRIRATTQATDAVRTMTSERSCLHIFRHSSNFDTALNVKHRITRDKLKAAICITATAAGLLFMTLNLAGWLAGKHDGLAVVLDFFAIMFCAWV